MALFCEVLKVSRSGFYDWLKRQPSQRANENESLLAMVLNEAKKQHGIPGYRKLWKAVTEQGYVCSKNRIQRLLQRVGYRSKTSRKLGYRKPISSKLVLPNLLNREFNVKEKNRVWTSDITQVRCMGRWLYIAVVLDLYSRKVVGWATSHINDSELVKRALVRAWKERKPDGTQLLFHSDQGVQYSSEKTQRWLNDRGITISMSRKGNCWDNACTESFFAQMKKEWFNSLDELTLSLKQGMLETQYYIEQYYNNVRRHGTLSGMSPIEFEET